MSERYRDLPQIKYDAARQAERDSVGFLTRYLDAARSGGASTESVSRRYINDGWKSAMF